MRATAACVIAAIGLSVSAAEPFPPVEQLPSSPTPPDLLTSFTGEKITTREQWEQKRRPELKALFQHYMYGCFPPAPKEFEATVEREDKAFLGGKATKKEIALHFPPEGSPAIHLLLVIPNQRAKPAPCFAGVNFFGNFTTMDDPSIPVPGEWMPKGAKGVLENRATEAGRGAQTERWQIERAIERGYAIATYYCGDLARDYSQNSVEYNHGIWPYYAKPGQPRGPQDWGAIAVWAWGLQRVVDYLVTDSAIDGRKIIAIGHSRLGKTAMLAAAFDERFAMVVAIQAGCGGTAPSRGKVGEPVKRINTVFPHWFCDEFKKFNDQTDKLPFDQHGLVALMAPRPVLFSCATEDTWANPAGQFEMLQAAEPVYKLLGAEGLGTQKIPEENKLLDSTLGYFIRPGKHDVLRVDWEAYYQYADKHFGK